MIATASRSSIIDRPYKTHPEPVAQIDGLQILRAVAALLVAWLHAGQMLGSNALPHFWAYGIDIFFVISGFIISSIVLRVKQNPGVGAMWPFLKRRLIRIFPIYWFFCGLASVRLILSHNFSAAYIPGFFLLPNIFPKHPLLITFAWTLVFEMFFYYSVAVALLFTVRYAVPLSTAVFVALVLAGHFVGIHRPIWIIVANPMLLEFIMGAGLALVFARLGRRRYLGIGMVALGIAGALYLRANPLEGGAAGIHMVLASVQVMRRVCTWGISAMLIVGGVIFWSPSTESPISKFAVVLGNASYSIYLASALIIEFAARVLVKFGSPVSLGRSALYQVLVVVAVAAGGWICYQFVERPMLRWLRRVSA